jgi:phosphoglycerol transferase MdoB-like AlkP superfamily enzyme
MAKSTIVRVGSGPVGLLGVAFVVLKLCKVIDWSWWWVTLPFWGGLALVISIPVTVALFAAVVWVLCHLLDKKRKW